jgi:type IV pilus assembly protein PilA
MKKIQKGFTLIELMIVIAILGILLAIAIPAYQDYTVRTRVTECFNLQAPIKLQIGEFYISNSSFPQAASVSVSRTTDYCANSAYTRSGKDEAIITVIADGTGVGRPGDTIGGLLAGFGCEENGDVEWWCYYNNTVDTTQGRFLPSSCRKLLVGADGRADFITAGGVCTNPPG